MKKAYIIGAFVLIAAAVSLILLRGDEDIWLCDKGQWVAHGSPSAPRPAEICYDDSGFNVFWGNAKLGSADDCARVFPHWREKSVGDSPGEQALRSLLSGPTSEEEDSGYFTSINEGVGVKSLRFENGTAFADFGAEMERGMGGSCRVTAIRSQIEKTLMQFPEIENVVISVEGRTEDILQP